MLNAYVGSHFVFENADLTDNTMYSKCRLPLTAKGIKVLSESRKLDSRNQNTFVTEINV